MKIISKVDVLNVSKPEGTNVTYYLFDEYEVHYNEQVPHSTQTWHHHERIWESLFIIEGELTVKWKENGEEKEQIVVERVTALANSHRNDDADECDSQDSL